MDVSVLAAVGSFVVSERVLKPKATLLLLLGAVLAYDLTTKTRDPSSLRVYRGPALLAFTLAMVALSLRTWRRNNVACDELLFLPGTPHAEETAQAAAAAAAAATASGGGGGAAGGPAQEGDAAAGGAAAPAPVLAPPPPAARAPPRRAQRLRRGSNSNSNSQQHLQGSLSSVREFADRWEEDGDDEDDENDDDGADVERVNLLSSTDHRTAGRGGSPRPAGSGSSSSPRSQPRIASAMSWSPTAAAAAAATSATLSFMPVPSEYRITRIGSFFFFRSSASTTANAAYAPSGPAVVGAAMDLSMPILFNFHLFIEAFNHMGDSTPAKVLPLIFLTVLIVRAVFPPGRRGRFWGTLRCIFLAPFQKSLTRDLFLGDVLTSLVRPGQDILFALSYYVTVIAGTVTGQYGLTTSSRILESSWVLHNVVLPSAALLPLWFRFLQALREAHDHNRRWPYLGNAFKYLSAAGVVTYGMVHSEDRRGTWWPVAFALCLLYQIWWDVAMDWELFVYAPRDEVPDAAGAGGGLGYCARISSVNPNNRLLLLCQQYYFQPVCEVVSCIVRLVCRRIPSWRQIQLRPKRLYKSDAFYWGILLYNILFRFAWMLCFIPAYHLSPSGRHHITTFSSDTNSYVGVLLPIAEILRRTFWGFLFLEVKTLQMDESTPSGEHISLDAANTSADSSRSRRSSPTAESLTRYQKIRQRFDCDREMRRKLFVFELCMWAAAFVGLALWATN